jgi:hypothetical protein
MYATWWILSTFQHFENFSVSVSWRQLAYR